jgi:carbonic anhydrase/acetyltransferase-like protein (isoleucine patch superfamily)
MIHGPAIIGDSTTIGIGAVVLQDSKVGSGCILAGGSVLTKKMEDLSLYAGSPAVYKKSYADTSKGKWDIELYMKNAKKFKEAGFSQPIPDEFLMR